MSKPYSFAKASKTIGGALLSLLLGIVGGSVCGAAILVFGAFIGRSGTTGTEYIGYWDVAVVPVGLFYGGLFGAFVGPLAYALVVRTIGFQKAIMPAFAGTILGGFAGAVAGPPFAALTGICGFFIALFWAKAKLSGVRVFGSH